MQKFKILFCIRTIYTNQWVWTGGTANKNCNDMLYECCLQTEVFTYALFWTELSSFIKTGTKRESSRFLLRKADIFMDIYTFCICVTFQKASRHRECFWKFSCLLYLIHVLNLCFKSCLSLHLYIFFSLSLCLFPLMSEYFCPGLGSKGSRNSWPSLAQPAQHQTKCLWHLNAQLLTVIHHHRAWTNRIEGRVHQRALL